MHPVFIESKSFADKARIIHLARVKKKENEELLNYLINSASGQEVILAGLKENERIIESGEKELKELVAANYAFVIRKVYQFTDDVNLRKRFLLEGKESIRKMLMEYDYSDVTHFYDNLQDFLAEFSVFMERSSI